MKELYDFSVLFFKNRGVQNASKKWEEVKVQMNAVLSLLDSLEGV